MSKRLLMLVILPLASAVPVWAEPPGIENPELVKTTLSYHFLHWLAAQLPKGDWRLLVALVIIVVAAHLLQLPILIKLRVAVRHGRRNHVILLLLAMAFTELVPLGWACANGPAWRIAFPAGRMAIEHVEGPLGLLYWATILIVLLGKEVNLIWAMAGSLFIAGLLSVALKAPFIGLAGLELITDNAAMVGTFMFGAGTVPTAILVIAIMRNGPETREVSI